MRRRSAGVIVGLVSMALSLALGAATASAACPNEAFRTGPSAFLAECRAYEMVTPVDKESGAGVFDLGGADVTASGDGIYFASPSSYAGAKSNQYFNPYVSRRSAGAWETAAVGGPQVVQYQPTIATTYAIDDGLGLTFLASKEALAPGAIPYGSNLYVHDLKTDTYTTVAALPGQEAFEEWVATAQSRIPFFAADADWSRIIVSSTQVLAPGGVATGEGGPPNLYEFSEGRLRLLVAEAGAPAGFPQSVNTQATPNAMSADGSRFYYRKEGVLYMRMVGQETPVLVSEVGGIPTEAAFVGATSSGNVAFFKTSGGAYRFEASAPEGSRVTPLTPGEGTEGRRTEVRNAWAGEDGTTLYFASKNQLTSDALPLTPDQFGSPSGYDLYVWHGERGQAGGIRYIGQSTTEIARGEESGPPTVSVSPDGRFLGFESINEVTPEAVEGSAEACPAEEFIYKPAGRCSNVFLYSYDGDRLDCVTCTGAPPVGDSRLGGREERLENVTVPSAVLDDGTIFFDTPNTLVPRDINGVRDAYGWRGGVPELISTGTDYDPSSFIDATTDGSDIFFATRQPLVGQDDDSLVDLYDARLEGGLPQGAPATSPPCSSESNCRPGIAPVASPGQIGTGTVGADSRGPDACLAVQGKAGAARRRSQALARRAKRARGRREEALRKSAKRESRKAGRLGRRARNCKGAGR